jgi:DNA-binding CsgD family transcriptional regulator
MPDLTLTKREVQVLQRIADGRLCKQVAAELHISERTVWTHITNIRQRSGIQAIPAMVAAALRQGLIK